MNILNNITLRDVQLFFSSKCCNKQVLMQQESSGSLPERHITPCQNSPQILDYFASCKGGLHAATITIGNKFYGSKSAKDQYKCFIRAIMDIKKFYRETDYYFTFELQRNGQLHAHGIIYNMYPAAYAATFCKFGKHNSNEKSFTPVKNLSSYWEYIHKETKDSNFLIVHNIKKNKIIKQIKNKQLGVECIAAGELARTEQLLFRAGQSPSDTQNPLSTSSFINPK